MAHFGIGWQRRVVRASHQKTRGRRRCVIVRSHSIGSELLTYEFIVRHVVIERVDNPIAIGPKIVARFVVFKAVGFARIGQCLTNDAPALAIVRILCNI